MSSLVTWDVLILVLIILKIHVWLHDLKREILKFESNVLSKNQVTEDKTQTQTKNSRLKQMSIQDALVTYSYFYFYDLTKYSLFL